VGGVFGKKRGEQRGREETEPVLNAVYETGREICRSLQKQRASKYSQRSRDGGEKRPPSLNQTCRDLEKEMACFVRTKSTNASTRAVRNEDTPTDRTFPGKNKKKKKRKLKLKRLCPL